MTCVRIPDENEIALATGFPSRMARLRHLVAIGAEARWGKPIPAATAQRLEEELSFIERVSASDPRLDFASYFLIIRDCVKDVGEKGACAGPWRGAASGSAVAYALGITTVDPLKHGLFFERFLGQSRIALPPVWLDFDAEGHETAVRHIADRYRECGLETPSRIIFEFHALKPLSVQRKCLRLVAERSGIDIDLERIPDSDQATMSVFADADTRDIFQFGSPEAMRWLRQIRPSCLADITAIGTLFYSPGLAMLFSDIVSRKNGEGPVECGHPLMESVLNETYGAVIYQEQIMSLAQRLAGFTRGESDALRYAMGKKMFDDTEQLKAKFIAGCLANPAFRVGEWRGESAAKSLCEKIWADWWSVASIAFNKSHAVAYTRLAWQSAYLKAHHPREYEEAFDFCYNVGAKQERDEGNRKQHKQLQEQLS